MRFGIMDHLDDSGRPPAEQYALRLKLIEAMDRLGYYSYHVAEHHGTPLGLAPSPSVYLAAVSQRTTRLRFGPMVYVASLYHPVRLAEEICMLDQMSGGRLQLGLGRGAVWLEHRLYGVERESIAERYAEARDILLEALTTGRVHWQGKYFQIPEFSMVLRPQQRPHPPLWYGLANPESAPWAAEHAANVVSLLPAALARRPFERYAEEWAKLGRAQADMPLRGLARHIVVAESDAEAQRIARAAFPSWRKCFSKIWDENGVPFPFPYPWEWDGQQEAGNGVAGSPATVRDYLIEQSAQSGCNLFLCQMVFGTITYEDALRSLTLFSSDVAPRLAER